MRVDGRLRTLGETAGEWNSTDFAYFCCIMDVTLLSTMISELITDHDMVGLPGLGTFVAEVVPATFSDKGYTINPPYRRLSFHPSRSEDTLLIDFYAASNGISKEAAALYLKQFLAEMKTVLKERKTIALPGLGRLRATVENNFFFVPDPDLDIYPDGFGLEPLSLKTITEPEPVEIPLVHQSRETVSAAVADTATATVAETAPATEIATTTSQGAAPVSEMNSALVSETETVITQSLGATPAIATEPAAEQAAASQPQPEPQPKAESQLAVQPYPAAEAASVSVSALPTEASAVRTGLKSCAPEGVVRTERSEEGVPCAPDGILRTEVPFVRTGAEFSAPGYGEHGNDGGSFVRTGAEFSAHGYGEHGNDGGSFVRTGAEAEAAPESRTSTGAGAEPESGTRTAVDSAMLTAGPEPAAEPELASQPASAPEPAAEPELQQAPTVSEPQPTAEPPAESAAEPELASQPASAPEPAAEPELQQAPAVSEPQPTAEPSAEPQPQSVTQSVTEPHLQPKPQPIAEPQPRHTSQRRFRWWVPVLILLAVAAVALLAFLTVAQVAPDFVDSILYSPEELRIINY